VSFHIPWAVFMGRKLVKQLAGPLFWGWAICMGGAGLAQEGGDSAVAAQPSAFPEFSAKRIRAPKPGTPPKINIQIETAPQSSLTQARPAETTDGQDQAPSSRYSWFWERVPAAISDVGAVQRFDAAMAALRTASAPVPAPRLQLLQEIIEAQQVPILLSSVGKQVSPALVLAVISVESAGKAEAVSSAGAQGLMQLMPDTAARFDVSDALVPEQNIAGGIAYLDWLLQEFEGDAILALAGYNAGEGAVRAHQGVPPFAETRDYVPKVLAAYDVARKLCKTPPEFISDGCVFQTFK